MTNIVIPGANSEFLSRDNGRILPEWYDKLDRMAKRVNSVRDWIYPEDYDARGATSSASATNNTTAFEEAMAACIAQQKKLVLRGYLDGTRKWFGITPTLDIPDGLVIELDGNVGIKGLTSAGILLRWRNTPSLNRGGGGHLIIDGGNELETIAGGLVEDHEAMVVASVWTSNATGIRETPASGYVYGTGIEGAFMQGVHVQNFGSGALTTYFLTDASIRDISGQRLGYFGTLHLSPLRVRQRGGRWDNIFPGLDSAGAAYERNAYGVSCANWSADRVPTNCEFREIVVEDVTSWEGFDFHNAIDCGFVNCEAYNCSQGFVFECHINGVGMQRNYVKGCKAYGYGMSSVRDSVTFYSLAGLIANASGDTTQSSVLVDDFYAESIGEGRPATTGGGGMVFRKIRGLQVNGARLYGPLQAGVSLIGATLTTDEILFANINGVTVDGVTSHNGVQRGFSAGTHILGQARGCYVQGIATKAAAYFQSGAATYAMNYGVIGDGASGTAQSDNMAYGAV